MKRWLPLFFIVSLIGACQSNNSDENNSGNEQVSANNAPETRTDLDGAQLAKIHCGTCHSLPDPGLLTKETWRSVVMPAMGPRLGIYSVDGYFYPLDPEKKAFGLYPSQAAMSEDDWKKLLDYYFDHAPDKPVAQSAKPTSQILKGIFKAQPNILKANIEPNVCMVKIDSDNRRFFVGHIGAKTINIIGYDQTLITDIKTSSPPSSMIFQGKQKDRILVSNLGTLYPNNEAKGNISLYTPSESKVIISDLQRPVKLVEEDLDSDGMSDLVVCNYGHFTGNLSWYKNVGDNQYEAHILKNIPGAIQVWPYDMNGDGLKDLVALFAQNEEQVVIFYNQGEGKFKEEQVLVFPSVYGSTYLELADFNKDGKMDLVVTHGDNADVSVQLKHFHGIKIYMNDGRNKFAERYFYPMYGAYKAMARDFDLDGDLDIAAISFFPDYNASKPENFVFLKQDGFLKFSSHYIPEADEGHWIAMDAGDLDGDGDIELLLGNFVRGPSVPPDAMQRKWKENLRMFLLLNNITR